LRYALFPDVSLDKATLVVHHVNLHLRGAASESRKSCFNAESAAAAAARLRCSVADAMKGWVDNSLDSSPDHEQPGEIIQLTCPSTAAAISGGGHHNTQEDHLSSGAAASGVSSSSHHQCKQT
jgi:hypothetical protein